MQRNLYSYLDRAGHDLVFSGSRDLGLSPMERTRGLLRGFRPAAGGVDVYLSTVPPLPFGTKAPLMTIVCDLRWLRTRSKLGSAYRAWDLRRSIRRSNSILCISQHTLSDLISFEASAAAKAWYHWLGPGQITVESFCSSGSGLLLIVGGAPHKRNEHAAAVLVEARPEWLRGIIGVGVSDQVRNSLSGAFPCEWHQTVSDTGLVQLYERADYFMMLGTDEGFGLPFVEALTSGCQVIATDHPLAREIVGSSGILLQPGVLGDQASQLYQRPQVELAVRRDHARKFSWIEFGKAVEKELSRIADPSR